MGGTISMDATTQKQQTMTEFMLPGKARRVWQIILAALLSLMILGMVYEFSRPQQEPVRMSTELSGDTYCYLDVALVSSWLLQVTGDENYTLYEAMDPDGNWFILNLDDETIATLGAQADAYISYYTEYVDNQADFPLPDAVRLTGMTHYLDPDDAKEIATIFDNATASDITAFYGANYFNEGASDQYAGAMLYLVFGVLFGIFLLVLVLQGNAQRKNYRKSEDRLYALGVLDDAEAEFSSPESVRFAKSKLVLSKRFVFSGDSGYVLPYEDIGWTYLRTQRSYGIAVGKQIMAGLVNGKTVSLANRAVTDAVLTAAAQAIYAANPNCLIGYSFDNIKLYNQRVKEYKLNHPN